MNTSKICSWFAGLAPLLIGFAASGCGGDHGAASGESDFRVASINLAPNCVWLINRPITIEFNQPVDFATVHPNSIQIRQASGTPAIGEFTRLDPKTISFQPFCPRRPDWSDAGLLPGGLQYELWLLGASPFSVRSIHGASLAVSDQRTFFTPDTLDPTALFYDAISGSPIPVVRGEASIDAAASCVEIGGDPAARIYFERANSGLVGLEHGFELPQNLISDAATRVAFLIAFDQPVDSTEPNISAARLRLEFQDPAGGWQALGSRLTLEQNCAGSGALVRIEPEGALPPEAQLRVYLSQDFRDLVGETHSVSQTEFAPAFTARSSAKRHDSLEEEFAHGGGPGSNEDLTAQLGLPTAEWGDGSLSAVLGFTGSGGVNGDFDWEVRSGELFVFDTTLSTLVGGPGFVHTIQQVAVNGVVDVRNFRVAQGGVLRFQGPNPVTILASGFVQIDGTIEVSGLDARGVTALFPPPSLAFESGAPGVAGGGRGGTGNPITTATSPKGGEGQGAFGVPDAGGGGGETTFWSGGFASVDARRGTGGGGARLGRDQLTVAGIADQSFIGLDAEPGFTNLFVPGVGQPLPIGAISGQPPPRAGNIGPSPFLDLDPDNDFVGASFDSVNGSVKVGELSRPWAGGGGGGGGNASSSNGGSFPPLPFNPIAGERGAGGGGGGGSLQIIALGKLAFGASGSLKCRGGSGGGGENTNFLDRVGGGSGGGGGGHVVLQSGSRIDFSSVINAAQVSINATGGQGGAGQGNLGGAPGGGPGGGLETPPLFDACPAGFPTTQCRGPISGAGGDGGPGILQLHTPKGLGGGDILLPPGRTLANLCKPTPVSANATQRLMPSFGRNSIARSVWIPIGAGGFDPELVSAPFFRPAVFEFGDVDPATGEVQATNGVVDLGPSLLGPVEVAVGPALPYIEISGRTIVLDASPLIGGPQEYFLSNAGLLKRSTLRLAQVGVPANHVRFDVATADFQPTSTPPSLRVTVSSAGPQLTSFSAPGGVAVELIPTYFRIRTDGVDDALPLSAGVFVKFQAAPAIGSLPDVARAVPPLPGSDIGELNASAAGGMDFRFLRIQIEFDIDRLGTGLSLESPRPALDFLRLPFRY